MENNYNTSGDIFGFGFDDQAKAILLGIARWTKIVAIVAFTSYGVSLVAQLLTSNAGASDTLSRASRMGGFIGSVIVAAIGIVINVYLYRFSNEIVDGVNLKSQTSVDNAFGSLKTYFQIIGILLIIGLVLFVFFLLLAII